MRVHLLLLLDSFSIYQSHFESTHNFSNIFASSEANEKETRYKWYRNASGANATFYFRWNAVLSPTKRMSLIDLVSLAWTHIKHVCPKHFERFRAVECTCQAINYLDCSARTRRNEMSWDAMKRATKELWTRSWHMFFWVCLCINVVTIWCKINKLLCFRVCLIKIYLFI